MLLKKQREAAVNEKLKQLWMMHVHMLKPADLGDRVCRKLAAVVDMQVRLVEGFDGNGLRVLPGHHLEHHFMPAYMCQLLHSVGRLYPDLRQITPSWTKKVKQDYILSMLVPTGLAGT